MFTVQGPEDKHYKLANMMKYTVHIRALHTEYNLHYMKHYSPLDVYMRSISRYLGIVFLTRSYLASNLEPPQFPAPSAGTECF